ncbi:VG15 protein [Phytohabitans aurantiacus]|uniref:MuF-like minor capsid protein n=1 Tax=Phytohabitans aurantiacus TaxID=3016789 RepID=A0ABQ5QKY6_9ACTN|nr:hypothetical protein [Phytohabitans aurantiacus]GLH94908.1 hypothetical protein Pa4123_01800 [Phytohabitans aurantiacus]
MAITAEGATLTRQHRHAQLVLRADVLRDMTRLWATFDATDLSASFARFAAAADVLIRTRHGDSAGLSAAYFERFRLVEGIPGTATPRIAATPASELVRDRLRASGLMGALNARRAGQSLQAAARNGFVRASGSAVSMVLGGGRNTIVDSVRADRQARGWQRATSGTPCAFCAMVASRGPTFKSQRSARFQAHDHCACTAEPFYTGSRELAANQRFAKQWETAQREAKEADELHRGTSNDALNAFRRHLAGAGQPQ